MAAEKARALVLRTTDWSETSRIATLWTREFGKVRVLAKGGRRLKSNFESALDLLTECGIVFLRKSSGGLDLLTEAQVVQRFAQLRSDLNALYAAYYVAELLADGTEDYDPHPELFDEVLRALHDLGGDGTAGRLLRFELVFLREVGHAPVLTACAPCGVVPEPGRMMFSPSAGGLLCRACQATARDRRPLSQAGWEALVRLEETPDGWRQPWEPAVLEELRQVLGHYVSFVLGRRPRLLSYLGG